MERKLRNQGHKGTLSFMSNTRASSHAPTYLVTKLLLIFAWPHLSPEQVGKQHAFPNHPETSI